MTLEGFLLVGAALFSIGLYIVLTRRNAVAVLMGVELMLNAANVNFAAFSRWHGGEMGGQVAALVVIVLAAAEAAVALAIFLRLYAALGSVEVDDATRLEG